MFREYFKEIQTKRRIKNRILAKAVKMSESHFSRFCSGKIDLSINKFWKLLLELDKVSPGAKEEFASKIAKVKFDPSTITQEEWENIIKNMTPNEVERLLGALAKVIGQIKN